MELLLFATDKEIRTTLQTLSNLSTVHINWSKTSRHRRPNVCKMAVPTSNFAMLRRQRPFYSGCPLPFHHMTNPYSSQADKIGQGLRVVHRSTTFRSAGTDAVEAREKVPKNWTRHSKKRFISCPLLWALCKTGTMMFAGCYRTVPATCSAGSSHFHPPGIIR